VACVEGIESVRALVEVCSHEIGEGLCPQEDEEEEKGVSWGK